MFDLLAYPVSLLMKLWHDLLALVLPGSGFVWIGSILLLVCTVKLILLRPAWKQMLAGRRTVLLQPQLAALKKKHGKDREKYVRAVQELQRAEGIGIGSSLLPMLLQIPVLIGLYHLLAGFTSLGSGGANGVFGPAEVSSFAHATMFGVPLSAAIRTPAETLATLAPGIGVGQVVLVVLPLLVIAAAATFVNMWRSQRRQPPATPDPDNPMAATMQQMMKLMVWLSPIALLIGGVAFPLPVALAIYWAVNGLWTLIQTQVMTARLDRILPLTATTTPAH